MRQLIALRLPTPVSRSLPALALGLALAGCSSVSGAPRPVVDPAAELTALATIHAPEQLARCIAQEIEAQPGQWRAMTPAEAQQCRNRIVSARKYAIDVHFRQFEESFFNENRWGGFGATLAALGLGVAGTVSGQTAAQALAAASAGLAGARASYEREILAERNILAIRTTMRGERDRIAARLLTGMRQGETSYPIMAALADLDAYQSAGTVLGALSAMNQSAGTQAAQAQAELARASGFARLPPSRFLQNLLTGDADEVRTQRQRIIASAQKLGISLSGVTVTRFVGDETRAAEHALVARDLGWKPD